MMQANRPRVLKQGWTYKRGSSSLSQWKLKWLVLSDQPQPLLYIYDQRDHALSPYPPKHTINPADVSLEIPEDSKKKSMLDKSKIAPFVLVTSSRKVSQFSNFKFKCKIS